MTDEVEEHVHETTAVWDALADVPEAVPALTADTPGGRVAALPRYTHALTGQSLVGSCMVPAPDGDWVRLEDVRRVL